MLKFFVNMPDSSELQREVLNGELSEVASKVEWCPRNLSLGDMPQFIQSSTGWVELEETKLVKNGRAFYSGDSHGLIFPMLDLSRKEGLIVLPVDGGIVNVDYHVDVAEYTSQTSNHSATWERFGVVKGFWSRKNAYNFRPHNSGFSHLVPIIPNFSNPIDVHKARSIVPEVLSVDLDFFNDLKVGNSDYQEYLDVVKNMAKAASLVMVFSSSAFINDPIKHVPRQPIGQLKQIVEELITVFY